MARGWRAGGTRVAAGLPKLNCGWKTNPATGTKTPDTRLRLENEHRSATDTATTQHRLEGGPVARRLPKLNCGWKTNPATGTKTP
ncbi:MAG TPA: hypothetical protein VIP98_09460, partial [Microlunatus sp.]